jgi:hypothetical protein
MRVLKPVLLGSADSVEITEQAEHNYVWKCQKALRTLVWHKGSCTSVSRKRQSPKTTQQSSLLTQPTVVRKLQQVEPSTVPLEHDRLLAALSLPRLVALAV